MYEFVPEIMCEASKIILSAHNIDSFVTLKDGQANFVTKFDVAVEEYLTREITKLLPEAVIIGEEYDDNHTELLKTNLSIIIDPIDGTTNFIHDYRHSAISVGICDRGQMVYGAVLDPYSSRLYHAERGSGAYVLNLATGDEKRISVSSRGLKDALIAFGTSPYYREELGKISFDTAYRLFCKCRDIRRSGSAALDLCAVACGSIDVFFEYTLFPWDFAAASLIIEEAGGVISQFDGSPITFDVPCGVAAGNKIAHSEMLRSIE